MSLDGFVAGPDPSHAGPARHRRRAAARVGLRRMAWREAHGREGGEASVDSDLIDELSRALGAGIMGRKMYSGGSGGVGGRPQRRAAGGATTRRSTTPCSCSPTTRASRWRWRAARRSTSSPTGSSPRSSRPAPRPGDKDVQIHGGGSAVSAVPRGRRARRAERPHRAGLPRQRLAAARRRRRPARARRTCSSRRPASPTSRTRLDQVRHRVAL